MTTKAYICTLSEVRTEQYFKHYSYMLGDKSGNYIVLCSDGNEDIYLGRYEDLEDAKIHVKALNTPSPNTGKTTLDDILENLNKTLNKIKEKK